MLDDLLRRAGIARQIGEEFSRRRDGFFFARHAEISDALAVDLHVGASSSMPSISSPVAALTSAGPAIPMVDRPRTMTTRSAMPA